MCEGTCEELVLSCNSDGRRRVSERRRICVGLPDKDESSSHSVNVDGRPAGLQTASSLAETADFGFHGRTDGPTAIDFPNSL